MGRWYTSGQYRDRIRQIKAAIPDVALSADVIVGFSGEAESHFENTAKLLVDEGFSRVHVFRYSIRPGTPAERLNLHVDPRVKSERTRTLNSLDKDLRRRYAERFIGQPVRVLVESDGCGYTDRYVRVRVPSHLEAGQFYIAMPGQITPEAILVA